MFYCLHQNQSQYILVIRYILTGLVGLMLRFQWSWLLLVTLSSLLPGEMQWPFCLLGLEGRTKSALHCFQSHLGQCQKTSTGGQSSDHCVRSLSSWLVHAVLGSVSENSLAHRYQPHFTVSVLSAVKVRFGFISQFRTQAGEKGDID